MVCNAKANDIHNNMPTVPTAPLSPDFTIEGVNLPELPLFGIDVPNFSTIDIRNAINIEDLEKADKFINLLDKEFESYSKKFEEENTSFQNELELYKSELENLVKDADRKTQVESAEYAGEIELYKSELQFFQSDLQEAAAEYKWYTGQYVSFISQYNQGLGIKYTPPKQQEGEKPKRRRRK